MILSGAIASATLPGKAQVGSPQAPIPPGDIAGSKSVEQPPIYELKDIPQSATTVKDWVAQIEAATVQVTDIKLQPTATGLEIILETAEGKPLQVDASKFRAEGNSLIAEIPNAALALPQGQTFIAENPTAEIATVQVVQQDASSIRVSVTGKEALPKSEVTLKTGAFTYSLNPEDEAAEEELVVTGEGEGSYFVPDTSTATKTNTPIRDIPASIQVVPQAVLRDQNVQTLDEALRNVTGVTTYNGPDVNIDTAYNIRGFITSSNNFLRNGLRDGGERIQEFTFNIERIEVLLGPASVLYGNANPGGTINIVTKQPLRDPLYAIDATIGNYDFYEGAIDLSGPLNDSKTLLYRLNVGYQDRGSFVDSVEADFFAIAPVLSWDIGKRTRLTVEGEYAKKSIVTYGGLPAVGTVLPNPNGEIPLDRFLGEPGGVLDTSLTRVGYQLEHQFNDNWSLKNAFSVKFLNFEPENEFFLSTNFNLADDNRTLNRQAINQVTNFSDYDLTTYLTGKFSTGSIKHELLIGVDLSSSFLEAKRFSTIDTAIDVFNPVYGNISGPSTFEIDVERLTETLGVYVQDQVTLVENLKLLMGGRFDLFRQSRRFSSDPEQRLSGNAFSPRIGIVYQPIQPISLYASYSKSFTPVEGTAFGGDTFAPEQGTQYEIGIKAEVNKQLSTTLAFYNLTRSNVLTTDPDNSDFSIQAGEQRSRGIELNIAGEILPGWNIIAGYAYIDAEITKDNTFPVGSLLYNVPKNSFNLWTSYEIQRGFLQGLGFGLGLFYVGERPAELGNNYQLPNYLRTDAAIFYKRDRFRFALNFRNLFNIDYFEGSLGSTVYPGAPFTVQGKISWEF
jgi:iron complex outermembrane receptor protein